MITLQLDPNFQNINATATVVYYNAGKGSWSIAYNGETKELLPKLQRTREGSNKIPLGVVSGNGKITLFSPDQKDCIFSLWKFYMYKYKMEKATNERKNEEENNIILFILLGATIIIIM